ncbi:transcriptional regulator [Candidatus Poribacteria bacterium]|nr:transcriptional regulator [Candidatus Poribacteria bacterium]
MNRIKQMARIIQVAHLIHIEPRNWTRRKLADRFDVNMTTIQRDIHQLRSMGIEIVPIGKKGYKMISDFFLPSLNFDFKEALALITAASFYRGTENKSSVEVLNSAIGKIMNTLPKESIETLNHLDPFTDTTNRRVSKIGEKHSYKDEIYQAIRERHGIHIKYNSFYSGRITQHSVSPYGVIYRKNAWYLIGRSETKREIRTFRINRIESLRLTQREYLIPIDFSIQEYLEKSWDIMLGPDTDIIIHFNKAIAPLIAEVNWHSSQQITTNTDGSIRFEVTVSGWEEIGWWVLGWGCDAKVIKPKELRDWVADTAIKMVEMYKKDN